MQFLFYVISGENHNLDRLPNICQTKSFNIKSEKTKHIIGNLPNVCKTKIPEDSKEDLGDSKKTYTLHHCSDICSLRKKCITSSEQCRHKFGTISTNSTTPLPKCQELLKKNTYVNDNVILHFTGIYRQYFKAQIPDTLFCTKLRNREWWPGREFFNFTSERCDSNKPSVFANKLLIPIFKNNHWSLCVRFKTVGTSETHDWEFIYLDSLNNAETFNETMGKITNRTSLAWNMSSLRIDALKKRTNVSSYTRRMCVTPKQEELECGCRLLFHMYLAMLSNTASELESNVRKLHRVESLSRNVRRWAYNIMNDDLSVCVPPGWFLITPDDDVSENIGK